MGVRLGSGERLERGLETGDRLRPMPFVEVDLGEPGGHQRRALGLLRRVERVRALQQLAPLGGKVRAQRRLPRSVEQ